MPRRYLWFLVVAGGAMVGFLRLGFWQLDRLAERRAFNASILARRTEAGVPLARLAGDTATARFRASAIAGRYDYDRQFIWTARTRNGAPGVVFLTPIVPDTGPAVLVNRGWAYSADGMSVDDTLWREAPVDSVVGYAEVFSSGTGPVQIASVRRGIRRLAFDSLQALLPYPILPVLLVQQRGTEPEARVTHPYRSAPPPMDEGPHRGYALQWFAFALITIVGTSAVIARVRVEARGPA